MRRVRVSVQVLQAPPSTNTDLPPGAIDRSGSLTLAGLALYVVTVARHAAILRLGATKGLVRREQTQRGKEVDGSS